MKLPPKDVIACIIEDVRSRAHESIAMFRRGFPRLSDDKIRACTSYERALLGAAGLLETFYELEHDDYPCSVERDER